MKRNEEQQRRLKMSKAHLVYAILFFILIVLGGRFIGGPALAFMGAAWGGIISAVWIAFAYGLYEDSKNPMVGRVESQLPKELQESIKKRKLEYEPNEEQKRALMLAYTNWALCSFAFIMLVVFGAICGGELGAGFAAVIGGIICFIWFMVACDLYEFSKRVLPKELEYPPSSILKDKNHDDDCEPNSTR